MAVGQGSGRFGSLGARIDVLFDRARGMTQNAIAALQLGCGRAPPAREPLSEELVRGRLMWPHGDRRDGSESGRIEAEERTAERQNHVVREFILRDDGEHWNSGALAVRPP